MDVRERVLYHQIHPAKLVTDVATALGAAVLFWRHQPGAALALGFIPSVIMTIVLLRWANLDRSRDSAFGRYVGRFMTRKVEGARLAGLLPLWGGAWLRQPLVMLLGLAWIAGCWLLGLRKVRGAR